MYAIVESGSQQYRVAGRCHRRPGWRSGQDSAAGSVIRYLSGRATFQAAGAGLWLEDPPREPRRLGTLVLANKPLFYGSYPITPASDVLHELARHKQYDVRTFRVCRVAYNDVAKWITRVLAVNRSVSQEAPASHRNRGSSGDNQQRVRKLDRGHL